MIISHKYRYIFFSIPKTASTAISHLLIDKYDGERYMRKHSLYDEFINSAPENYHGYFKFTTIRNPLDQIVSEYFKKKNDHKGRFSRGRFKNGVKLRPKAIEKYNFIRNNNATFSEFFNEFYNTKYERPRILHTISKCDLVIRFESLQKGFDRFTQILGLNQCDIPIVNQTHKKDTSYDMYYDDSCKELVYNNFLEYMNDLNYSFPNSWTQP